MSYIGNNKIGKVYLGNSEIAKAYLGDDLVFQNGGGPTPPTPTLVFYDYLYFDGTAYIDTTLVPPENASFRCNFGNETTKGAQRYFGAAANGAATNLFLNNNTNSTNRNFTAYYQSSSSVVTSKTLAFSYPTFNFFLTPERIGIGASTYTFTGGANAHNGGIVFGSNSSHSGNPYTGRMTRFRVYGSDARGCTSYSDFDNYTPVYTIRPCTYNGEAGLWCEETSQFFGNSAGSGTLTASDS